MKTRTLVVVAFAFLLIAGARSTASAGQAVASLRVNESLEAVVADLEAFIPAYMEQEGVPGVAIALVTGVGVYVWSGSYGLCLVIVVAMVVSMVIAGVSGAAIPLALSALRQDPAQSGSIILTTVTDVMGFLSFLGLATLLSGML